jgi:hypothetical protein
MTPEYSGYLAHHGVKGQKWGVRRYQEQDGSLTWAGRRQKAKELKRIAKEAKKDASEYARAKAYYGEGAGIRRKKIKNLTSEKMKDPRYKAEFERQLPQQNMAEHQRKATNERRMRDAGAYAAQTARDVGRFMLGFGGTTLASLATIAIARNGGVKNVINKVRNIPITKVFKRGFAHNVGQYKWH